MQDALSSKSSEDMMRPDHAACLQILAQLLVRQQASQYKHCVYWDRERERERERDDTDREKLERHREKESRTYRKSCMWVSVKWQNRILLSGGLAKCRKPQVATDWGILKWRVDTGGFIESFIVCVRFPH